MSSNAANRARSFTIRPISTCRPIQSRGNCRRARASPAFVCRKRATARSTGARTIGWRFSAPSYFRAIGELRQYGLSSRGVALDVAVAGTSRGISGLHQFLYRFEQGGDNVIIYALLEGPSIVGAYRFDMMRGKGVVMDIDAALFLRADMSRFGIAPLTSMYWFSETKKPTAVDWRPEVHDSDGLAMWTGNGERLWRPLNNPPRIMVSAFFGQQSAWLRPAAARPQSSTITRTACIMIAVPACGLSLCPARRRGLGQGRHPALRNPDRRRDP